MMSFGTSAGDQYMSSKAFNHQERLCGCAEATSGDISVQMKAWTWMDDLTRRKMT